MSFGTVFQTILPGKDILLKNLSYQKLQKLEPLPRVHDLGAGVSSKFTFSDFTLKALIGPGDHEY